MASWKCGNAGIRLKLTLPPISAYHVRRTVSSWTQPVILLIVHQEVLTRG